MKGTHIISDLKEINFKKLKLDEEALKNFLSEIISKNGLTELWNYYHTFWKNNEITAVVALAESHISIHTWPEFSYVSLDIFVCNLKNDNSQKAKNIFYEILKFFGCKKYDYKELKRII